MSLIRCSILAAIGLAMILVGCRPQAPTGDGATPQITVGAAANLTDVFGRIGPEFEKATGIHPVMSFASTAQLALQIENSAPFDVFLAADAQHVEELDRKGLLTAGTKAVYARGVLALWMPGGDATGVNRIEDLAKPSVHTIAIAKPELAPYGQAAVESLQKAAYGPRWNRRWFTPKISTWRSSTGRPRTRMGFSRRIPSCCMRPGR